MGTSVFMLNWTYRCVLTLVLCDESVHCLLLLENPDIKYADCGYSVDTLNNYIKCFSIMNIKGGREQIY